MSESLPFLENLNDQPVIFKVERYVLLFYRSSYLKRQPAYILVARITI